MQAAHGPHKASKGMGTKCADQWAMPLSLECHALQHKLGWQTFAARYLPGDPLAICASYWFQWPSRLAWERKNGA